MMLISIITVTYNCEDEIGKTLESVTKQSFKDYELLLIDGKSSDNTIQVANRYKDKIPNMRIYSEPDRGIYDAMNKGALLANGIYIYYLNAGDTFLDDALLKNVAKWLEDGKDIYYGSVLKGENIESYPKNIKILLLTLMEKMVCHQAIFSKRSLYTTNLYDLKYQICADREWLIRMLKKKASIERMDRLTICEYDLNGASSNYEKFSHESLRIAREYVGVIGVFVVRIKRFIGEIVRH